jgi:hypothetical protein
MLHVFAGVVPLVTSPNELDSAERLREIRSAHRASRTGFPGVRPVKPGVNDGSPGSIPISAKAAQEEVAWTGIRLERVAQIGAEEK